MKIKFFIGMIFFFVFFSLESYAALDLSEVGFEIVDENADPIFKQGKLEYKPFWVKRIDKDLPTDGEYFNLSIKTDCQGYPGGIVKFKEPVDFSKYDVLETWFRVDEPASYFQVVLGTTGRVTKDMGFAEIVPSYASLVKPNVWHRVLLHYKEDGWVRYGDKMDYTSIDKLTYYTDCKRLLPKDGSYNYQIGGLKLYTKAELSDLDIEPKQPPLYSAARICLDKDALIWTADASETILHNSTLPSKFPEAKFASVKAAGNEYASLVFVINSKVKLENLTAVAGDISLSQDEKISKNNITLRYADRIGSNSIADALPIADGKKVALNVGENFILWVTVYVPDGTVAGTYTGEIALKGSSCFKKKLPIKVEVYNFSIPQKPNLKSMFTVQHFYGGIGNFEKNYMKQHWPAGMELFNSSYKTMIDNIIKNYGEHRITPNLNYDFFDLSYEDCVALIEKYDFDPMFRAGHNTLNYYKNAEPLTTEKRKKIFDRLKEKAEQLKSLGAAEKSYIKIGDEPKADDLKYLKMAAEDARNAAPYIKTILTAEPLESLYGYVDIWCPIWARYDFMSEQALARKAAGDEFWTYESEYKSNKKFEPMEFRVAYWMYWKFGLTGVLYSHHIPSFFLNYPNDSYPHSDGLAPIPSIRWEMIRHGMQDYEYLWLLNDAISKAGERGEKFKHLLDVPQELARNQNIYTTNPQILNWRRDQVAKAIEQLLNEEN